MSRITKGIAKTTAAAALVMTLAAGSIAPGIAFGDVGTDKGTITIACTTNNGGQEYYAYKIFTCDVELKSGSTTDYVASSITWPSSDMEEAVQGAIETYDNTYTGTTAQDAADYITYSIKGTDSSTRVGANGLAENLAKRIDDEPPSAMLTAGTVSDRMDEGYYLIVSNPSSISGAQVGTAPIFTMLGNGQALAISEKTSMPTITKTLVEDSAANEQRSYADAQAGQDIDFTITSTVPDSIATFTKYYYKIEDEIPDGMSLTCAGESFAKTDVTVQVALGDTPTIYSVDPASFDATYSDGKLTVEFADLKTATDTAGSTISIDPTAKVIVTYKASLNSNATVGAPGNINTATLTYSNNPQQVEQDRGTPVVGTSATTQATVYEYQLDLYKYDKADLEKGTKTPLPDAKFTIQVTNADDGASSGKYVQADGTLDSAAYEFATDSSGIIRVKGLDAGTYTIHETDAPSGYDEIASDLVLEIAPSFWSASDADLGSNAVGSLKSISATLSGGNGDSEYTKVDTELTDNGVIAIQVSNEETGTVPPAGVLPLTGASGLTLVYLTGSAILAISLVVIIRRRLKAQK